MHVRLQIIFSYPIFKSNSNTHEGRKRFKAASEEFTVAEKIEGDRELIEAGFGYIANRAT